MSRVSAEAVSAKKKSPAICPCPTHIHLQIYGLNLDFAELLFSEMHHKVCAPVPSLTVSVLHLEPQPLDILTSEVNPQRQNLTHLRWGQPPCQRARVWAPVIQDLSYLHTHK